MEKINSLWEKINIDIDKYKVETLNKIYTHFGISYKDSWFNDKLLNDDSLKEYQNLIHIDKSCTGFLLNNLCIYKNHIVKPIRTENFETKIYHRIKEIKFDEKIGEYYLILYKNCMLDSGEIIVYDYQSYFTYGHDKSEFDNKKIQTLKNLYKNEDSIKERKNIKNDLIYISQRCSHYFTDVDDGRELLKCKKCQIMYDSKRIINRYYHEL